MTRKSLIFLTAIIMSCSLPALAKNTSPTNKKRSFLNAGVSLGFSNEATVTDRGLLFQYGRSLTEKKSVSTGISVQTSKLDNQEADFFGFQGNCENDFLTKGPFVSGLEAFLNVGASSFFPANKKWQL